MEQAMWYQIASQNYDYVIGAGSQYRYNCFTSYKPYKNSYISIKFITFLPKSLIHSVGYSWHATWRNREPISRDIS